MKFYRNDYRLGASLGGSVWRALFGIAVLFAASGLGSAALAEFPVFAPAGEHFSVQFPSNPTETISQGTNPLHQWSATDDNFVYVVNRSDRDGGTFTVPDLAANLNDFIKGVNGVLVSQQMVSWPSPDSAAQALRATFRLPNGLLGYVVFVIDGSRSFGVGIVDRQQGEESPYMTEFVNSLTILP